MADAVQEDSYCIDLCCGIGPFVIPVAKRGIPVLANDLNPQSIKWLKKNITENLTLSKSQSEKVKKGKIKNYGEVTVLNKDGHDVIKDDLYQMVKTGESREIECLMNLPGGAVFFLPTFKELENRLNRERALFKICVHVYLFGPKYKTKDDRPNAFAEVKKIVEENFGAKIPQMEIREVRDISVNNLQYCASFHLKSESDCPLSKRIKTG